MPAPRSTHWQIGEPRRAHNRSNNKRRAKHWPPRQWTRWSIKFAPPGERVHRMKGDRNYATYSRLVTRDNLNLNLRASVCFSPLPLSPTRGSFLSRAKLNLRFELSCSIGTKVSLFKLFQEMTGNQSANCVSNQMDQFRAGRLSANLTDALRP